MHMVPMSGGEIYRKIRHRKTGEILFQKLFEENPSYGGRQCIIVGTMGSGKTTLLLKIAKKLLNKEIIIWRARSVENLNYLPEWKEKLKFLHHKNNEVHIYEVRVGGNSREITEELELETYESPEDLLQKVEKGRLNVVIEPSYWKISEEIALFILEQTNIRIPRHLLEEVRGAFFWYELFAKIIIRKEGRWIAIFADECDDLFPANPSGLQWKLQAWAKDAVKDFRKSLVSLFLAVHNLDDVDYRIVKKIPIRIYLPGSKIPKDSVMKNKNIGSKLKLGTAKIEWKEKAVYGGIRFSPFEFPESYLLIEKVWKGKMPKLKDMKKSIIDEVREIAETEGKKEALQYIRGLYEEGEISRRYYYKLKRIIEAETN